MKIVTEVLCINSSNTFEFIDVTDSLQTLVSKTKISQGFILIRSRHTTGAITCTEGDASIHQDAKELLDQLMPLEFNYKHSYEGKTNGRAHQAEMLGFGCSTWAPIAKGAIDLGTWQRIYFVELFRPMKRKIDLVIVGE